MKMLAVLSLLLALGFSSASFIDFGDDGVVPPIEDLAETIVDGEIVDMDDAIQKYHMLNEISRIVAQAEARDLMNNKKRFIGGVFDKIKETIKKAKDVIKEFFTKAWNKAKEAVSKVSKKIDFKGAVAKLVPYIHSGETVAACEKALEASANAILGPAAPFALKVALPICHAALAKLQDVVG